MIDPKSPALVLAPMEGITDAPMRAIQCSTGAFTYAVSEFLRVSTHPVPPKVFTRHVPELLSDGQTAKRTSVQVQILGGDPDLMAQTAVNACLAGARSLDINFGCPAKTVNRHDGGATLLKYPSRIREIVAAVRQAVPEHIPVSAKLRLGWDTADSIDENSQMAAEGGASWITIHARTRLQGYQPPVDWRAIGRVRKSLDIAIVANGDIWTIDDFFVCRDLTRCNHFMIGRSALANPGLSYEISEELGIRIENKIDTDWPSLFESLVKFVDPKDDRTKRHVLMRLKQWMKLAHHHGKFPCFHDLKSMTSLGEFMGVLKLNCGPTVPNR